MICRACGCVVQGICAHMRRVIVLSKRDCDDRQMCREQIAAEDPCMEVAESQRISECFVMRE